MAFVKATRTRAFIKLALTGPSGSGKTLSALKIARGLAGDGKIALIDTENESASLYADATDFDTCPIAAPFTTEKYIEAIQMAADAGYSVLIIDSLTHAWAGEGGLLSQKESLDARGGNQYTNWASITKKQEQLKAKMLQSPVHVIATMRSKQEYAVEQNSNGKAAPKKVGMAPIQRDGMEYEFTIVLDMGMNHEFAASKDRTGLFDGKYEVPRESHGAAIRAWLESGAEPKPQPPDPAQVTSAMVLFADEAHKIGLDVDNNEGKPSKTKMVALLEKIHTFLETEANPNLPHSWNNATDHLEAYAKSLRTGPAPVPNTTPAQAPTPKEVHSHEAADEELTDPFAETPDATPVHSRGKKSAPANHIPGTDGSLL